jgi:hypothetical protein
VSDFISRLAARAVAQTPVTRTVPPAVSRAEPAVRPPQTAVEPRLAQATPAAPAVRSEAPEARVEPARPAKQELVTESSVRERIVEKTVVRHAAPPPPEPVDATPARERQPEPVEVVRAAPVAATPTAVRVVETSVTRLQAAASVQTGEPPVRVHIGRLEVRANLEQPSAPPQPRSRPAAPERLSLGEYLRGRKSA